MVALGAFWNSPTDRKTLKHADDVRRELPLTIRFSLPELGGIDTVFILQPVVVTRWFGLLFHGSVRSEAGFPGFVPLKKHIERSIPMPKKPFVDFRDIRSRITMEQVLEHYGVLHTFKRTGNRLSGPCPIHGGSNPSQFRVETEKNIWNCFSECKHGGNTLDFIARKENISIHEAAIKACEWFNIPLEEVKTNGQSAQEAEEHASPEPKATSAPAAAAKPMSGPAAAKPNGSHSQDDGSPQGPPNPPLKFKLEKLNRDHPYFEQRGITLETVIDFGLGYFAGDKGLMVGRIVIPITNVKGEVVAYAGRWPGEPPSADTPKYKLPTGFRKGLELFNIDRAVKEQGPLVIVEGFFDAIKLHHNGWRRVVALMGSTMTSAQEELIKQHTGRNDQIIVMLDEDAAGQAGRENIAARLSKCCYVKIHVFDKPDMQPEHLTGQEVHQLFV